VLTGNLLSLTLCLKTVILDCCYSAADSSVYRCNESSRGILHPRLTPTPIPANLDRSLLSAARFTFRPYKLPNFRHPSVKTHIVLAACKPEEFAIEYSTEGCAVYGQFTAALLVTLRSLDMGSTTYSELIRRLPPLDSYVPFWGPGCSLSDSASVARTHNVMASLIGCCSVRR
jgi:hypothetical protein